VWVHLVMKKKLEFGIFSRSLAKFLPNAGCCIVASVSVFTTRGIADCLVRCLANRINLSALISQRKIAAGTPDHWSLTKIKRVATRLSMLQVSWYAT